MAGTGIVMKEHRAIVALGSNLGDR
ncbi:MAG: hypothetical protein RLZZ544_99, partial [Actinomycetota bacterium]